MNWGDYGSSLVAVDAEAALAWHLDQLRGRAGRGRQGDVAGAEGNAAHRSIDAGALVFATSTEILTILINPSVVFAGTAFCLCPADAMGTAYVVAVVALQAFVMVAGPSFMAVLVKLGGAHLAAATAVGHRADPRGTGRGPCRTLTHHRTASTHQADGHHLQDSE